MGAERGGAMRGDIGLRVVGLLGCALLLVGCGKSGVKPVLAPSPTIPQGGAEGSSTATAPLSGAGVASVTARSGAIAAPATAATSATPAPAAGSAAASANTDWPVYAHDPQRSGVNPNETAINPSTVGGLRRQWVQTLPQLSPQTV